MSSTTPLPVGVGYGVVVGIGFFFAAVMCGISYIQVRIISSEVILEDPSSQFSRIGILDFRQRQVKNSILPVGASSLD